MAYIGNIPKTANFAIDTFNGDNSTVNFTLRDAPATTSAILVFVGGIRQHTDTYTLSERTLQFSEAPPTGTNNIQVLFLGIGTTTTVPADGTVSTIKIASQAVTGDKLGLNSIGGNAITALSITGDKIGLTAINANNIVVGSITNDRLATPGATTGKSIAMSIVFGG